MKRVVQWAKKDCRRSLALRERRLPKKLPDPNHFEQVSHELVVQLGLELRVRRQVARHNLRRGRRRRLVRLRRRAPWLVEACERASGNESCDLRATCGAG